MTDLEANLKHIPGNWDDGWALDKHSKSSVPLGENQYGHMQYNTVRTEVGQALYELKYNGHDWSKVPTLADALVRYVYPKFDKIDLIVSMPASSSRPKQPVDEIAKAVGNLVGIPVHTDFLIKAPGGPSLKDLTTKTEKEDALAGKISVNYEYAGDKKYNVLLIDDLYHTGASMEAAVKALRGCLWIDKIYVATLTWK